jgi:flagellar biosynthetic protein FliO
MLQQFLAVFLVLALLLAALWLMRRKGFASMRLPLMRSAAGARKMQVVERVTLSAQHSLHLVSLGGRLIVVGVSPGGCNRIAVLPANAIEESTAR